MKVISCIASVVLCAFALYAGPQATVEYCDRNKRAAVQEAYTRVSDVLPVYVGPSVESYMQTHGIPTHVTNTETYIESYVTNYYHEHWNTNYVWQTNLYYNISITNNFTDVVSNSVFNIEGSSKLYDNDGSIYRYTKYRAERDSDTYLYEFEMSRNNITAKTADYIDYWSTNEVALAGGNSKLYFIFRRYTPTSSHPGKFIILSYYGTSRPSSDSAFSQYTKYYDWYTMPPEQVDVKIKWDSSSLCVLWKTEDERFIYDGNYVGKGFDIYDKDGNVIDSMGKKSQITAVSNQVVDTNTRIDNIKIPTPFFGSCMLGNITNSHAYAVYELKSNWYNFDVNVSYENIVRNDDIAIVFRMTTEDTSPDGIEFNNSNYGLGILMKPNYDLRVSGDMTIHYMLQVCPFKYVENEYVPIHSGNYDTTPVDPQYVFPENISFDNVSGTLERKSCNPRPYIEYIDFAGRIWKPSPYTDTNNPTYFEISDHLTTRSEVSKMIQEAMTQQQ